MDFVISGGLGFIGINLATYLVEQRKTFKVLDKMCNQDICESSQLKNLPKFQTFVHLAAFTNVRQSILLPSKAINENILGLTNCLDCVRDTKAHFIYTSSMGAPLSLSPYQASKLAGEFICNAYRESYGVEATTLRLSNVYGPRSKYKNSVVSSFIKRCCDGEDIEIFGNGLQTRDFVHVEDVCNTIINCTKQKTINVASGTTISILELAEIIRHLSFELINFRPEIKWKAAVRGEIEKVDANTDITPTVLLEDGLKSTFEWFKDYYITSE